MNRLKRPGLLTLFFACAVLLSIAGCSAIDKELQGKRDPGELYSKGMAAYSAGKHEDSEKFFKKLMEDHPLSQFAVEAQLMLGDVYFITEKYDDASSYYTNFAALHPTHPKAAYAVFQKGMSHFKDILTIDRDLTSTRKALFAFQDLAAAYPGSPYAPKARDFISFLRKRLAEREFYVGRFYFKNKNYKGALARFRDLLKDYPDSGLTDQTLFYIGESYSSLGEKKLADDAYATILTNFPESPLAKDARNKLKES